MLHRANILSLRIKMGSLRAVTSRRFFFRIRSHSSSFIHTTTPIWCVCVVLWATPQSQNGVIFSRVFVWGWLRATLPPPPPPPTLQQLNDTFLVHSYPLTFIQFTRTHKTETHPNIRIRIKSHNNIAYHTPRSLYFFFYVIFVIVRN